MKPIIKVYVNIVFFKYNIEKLYLPVVGLGVSVVVLGDSKAEIVYIKYE